MMATSTQSCSTCTACNRRSSTTRTMIRNCSPYSRPSDNGATTSRALHMSCLCSNHKNLEYFATTKQLMCRQVHWSEYLSGFNYLICYRAGRLGTKPDVLTRHEDVYPRGENAYALANPHNFQSMFKAGTP